MVANTPVSTSMQADNVLEVKTVIPNLNSIIISLLSMKAAKRAKRSLADSFNTMVGEEKRRKKRTKLTHNHTMFR